MRAVKISIQIEDFTIDWLEILIRLPALVFIFSYIFPTGTLKL